MRLRLAFTLWFTLILGILLAPADAGAQPSEPGPAQPPDVQHTVRVAQPRAAVRSVLDGAAEAFLRRSDTTAEAPLRLPTAGSQLRLTADYEALLFPLTAGWARYRLEAWRIQDSQPQRLADDTAEVVAFGPARRAGRLALEITLRPGLHEIELVSYAGARPLGTEEWTADEDRVRLWVLVPEDPARRPTPTTAPQPLSASATGSAPDGEARMTLPPGYAGPNGTAGSRGTILSGMRASDGFSPGIVSPAVSESDRSNQLSSEAGLTRQPAPGQPTDPTLPVGGLSVGAQRAIGSPTQAGALNMAEGHGATLVVRVDQPVRVWSDYEAWWTEQSAGEARLALVIERPTSAAADGEVVARDVAKLGPLDGPHLADGTLQPELRFAEAGHYRLMARLESRLRAGDVVAEDVDRVPFAVRVVATEPPVGAIAGRVMGTDGAALEGIHVIAVTTRGQPVGRARTNADGAYRIGDLEPGTYYAHAVPDGLNFVDLWWADSATMRDADPIDIQAGATTDGIDFKLPPGGTVRGRVIDAGGAPLGGIEITVGQMPSALDPNDPDPTRPIAGATGGGVAGRTLTNDDGRYSIDGLRAGTYWVRARDADGHFLTEFYDDQPSAREADPVPVAAGEISADIDFALAAGGRITGHVRPEAEQRALRPLAGIRVAAYDPDDPTRIIAETVAGREGRYALGALPEGRYLVRADDPSGHYATEWYEEAARPEDATVVAVEAGHTTEGIDFTLAQRPRETRIHIDPAHTSLRPNGHGRFAVAVAAVENLGAFEATLRWDPTVFHVAEVALGPFLGSTGREVVPVEPIIDNAAGRLEYAAASVGRAAGPSGDGVLFVVHIEAGDSPAVSAVELAQSVLTDPAGETIEHGRAGGKVTVGACMRGDVNCDCRIDIRDVMAVVGRWGSVEGDPDYDPALDLDDDGDIDIVDVQIVAGLWGTRCDTEPTPGGPAEPRIAKPEGRGAADASRGERGPARALPSELAGAELTLAAAPAQPQVGSAFELRVDITDVAELAGFDLAVRYDPTVLTPVEAALGPFVTEGGRTALPLGPQVEADGTAAVVRYGALTLPDGPAPSGEGTLATLRFEVLAAGATTLDLIEATTVDARGESAPAGGSGVAIEAVPRSSGAQALLPLATR